MGKRNVQVSGGGGGGTVASHDHTTTDSSGVLTNSEFDGFLDGLESTAPATPAANHVRLWIEDKNGLSEMIIMDSGGKAHVIGQDGRLRVRNTTASIITAGQLVYVTGATGNVPNVGLAKADSLTTLPAIGFADADIAVNGYGRVHFGGVHTPAVTTGYTAGDVLYVSAATAGAVTNVEPAAPNFSQSVGHVLTVGVSGEVYATFHDTLPFNDATSNPLAIGTTSDGTERTAARKDHVHATGAGTPSTQAFGDAATTGTGPAAAMTDHKHAMPANPVTAHEAASDPHTGYRLESADHSHLTTGAQAGNITQAASHESPDTDAAAGSLHHTVGTGATQAAAGNHGHSSLISTAVDIQTFTANGTWNKPTGAKWCRVLLIAPGGSGGGGAANLNASVSGGGGGGGGGMIVEAEMPASLLATSETVTIPAPVTGGLGGLTGQGSNQAGASPADPGNATFGDLVAIGGGSGSGGSTAKGNGGLGGGVLGVASTQGAHGSNVKIGAPGGDGSTGALAGIAGTDIPHNSTNYLRQGGGGGGGGGGRAASGGTVYAGGDSGIWWNKTAAAKGAGASAGTGPNHGTDGTAISKSYAAAQGGGGGGGGQGTGQPGNGGNGAAYGGGAGGGGGCQSTSAAARAGQGGTGGSGLCVVVTYL